MNTEEFTVMTSLDVKENLNIIIEYNIPLRRKKKDGTFSFIPPKDFDLYLKKTDMTFYIDLALLKETKELHKNKHNPYQSTHNTHPLHNEQQKFEDKDLIDIRVSIQEMTFEQRILSIIKHGNTVKSYVSEDRMFDTSIIKEISDIFGETLCINEITLSENQDSPLPAENLSRLAKGTKILVDNLITFMDMGKASFKDFARLDYIQTGSNTLNHMNRMLIRFISFLFFYNTYFQKHTLEVQKFRTQFNEKYYKYYSRITEESQKINLEIVFKNGIGPIQNKADFVEFTLGGFLHDIGKLNMVSYHDGTDGYDKKKATRHVFDSYNMLINAKQFSPGVISSGLLHHDYYFKDGGYNQLNTFQSKFIDRRKNQREQSPTKYFMSFNINDVGYKTTYSYFPNKVIEILDIFDAMTDKDKKYREKPYSIEDALKTMRKEYIDIKKPGLDPILFNIFVDYIHESGLIPDPLFPATVKI